MPVFETITQLDNYVKEVTIKKEIIPVVKIVNEEKLNARVESEIYDNVALNGDNDFYENTFGLRDASLSSVTPFGNGVFFDGNLVETFLNPNSKYTAYYGGQDVTNEIVDWLNNGHRGFYKGLTINDKGRKFIEKAQADLTKGSELKKRVTESLKRLGYVISRRSF